MHDGDVALSQPPLNLVTPYALPVLSPKLPAIYQTK